MVCYGNTNELDTLAKSVLDLPNDSIKVAKLNTLSYEYVKVNIDSALLLSKQSVKLSRNINSTILSAESLNQLGLVYKYQAKYDSALLYYSKSLELYNSIQDYTNAARVLNRMGNVYKRFGNFEKSIDCFLQSLNNFKQINDSIKIGWVLNNLGALYYDMGYYDEAIEYYSQDIQQRKKMKYYENIHTVYMNIANAYAGKNDNNKALIYYNLSLENLNDDKNKYDKMLLVHNMGTCYEYIGKFKDAQKMYLKAIEIEKEINEKEQLIYSLQGVGNIYIKLGEPSKGLKYLLEAFDAAKEIKDIRKEHKLSKNLFSVYENLGDYKKGMFYLKNYVAIDDSIYNLDKKNILIEQEEKYKAKSREQQIAYLQKEKDIQTLELQKRDVEAKKKSIQRNLLGIIVVLTFVVLYFLILDNIKRKKRNALLIKQNKKIVDQRTEIVSQNQELLESNKTKDKLFQIIAHDLRSPLISIDSLTQLVPYWVEEQDYDSLQKLAKTMEISITNVLSLIDDLLNWALSQQGKFPYNPENFKIVDTLNEAVKIYYPVAELKSIELKLNLPQETIVFADRNMFLTILRNLLNNAIKFTPEKGKIEVGIDYNQQFAKIWVKDSGIGIPEEKKEEIFELASSSSHGTRGEAGKGLGLFFCKEFVNLNNGDVFVDSTYKKGTKIVFTLPLLNTSVN